MSKKKDKEEKQKQGVMRFGRWLMFVCLEKYNLYEKKTKIEIFFGVYGILDVKRCFSVF